MKKLSKKDKPSNLKKSKQNIDEVGRTSQGGKPSRFTPTQRVFLKNAKTRQPKMKAYSLGDAMKVLGGNKK
jgi:hypothetical protein